MNQTIGYKYHNCKQLPEKDIEIVYADFQDNAGIKQWWLHLYREATEKDLMDDEADIIGEILFSNIIVISFCPFCGKLLNELHFTKRTIPRLRTT
ncbi:MAG: hypothetical protein KJ804_02820 [Proteobacteria bacterium]|nr:hypothetical protein [Pseudomonadota bacterium]MBU1057237.1 hypothetical protein [Pseudomonadota bacterium]